MNKMRKKSLYDSRGQVLLVVVIVMVVALTIGLSIASRTITNLKLSRQNEDAQKAFQAASAGIDRYINQAGCGASGCPQVTQTLSTGQVATTVKDLQGNTLFLNNGEYVDQDRGIDLWLSTYPTFTSPFTGTINIYWGIGGTGGQSCSETGTLSSPALEVLILTGSTTSPVLTKYVYDDCTARRTGANGNNFTDPTGTGGSVNGISGITFLYNTGPITITNGLIAKVIPIYNSTKIAVVGSGALPPQGKVIESVGSAGDTKRKIIYYESYPQIPNEIFPYAILSQ